MSKTINIKKRPNLDSFVLIGYFSDKKHRQIIITQETGEAILQTIVSMEEKINVSETPLTIRY